MALPKSVKKQASEAQKLQDELNQPPAEPGLDEENEATKEPVAQAAEPVKPPEAGAEPAKDENWEKRFKGMNELYNREVPKLRGELEKAYINIDDLKKDINEVKANLQEAAKPADPEPVDLVLTDEEREQYGEGWINMMQKIAGNGSEALAKQVVDLQRELAELKQGQTDIKQEVRVTNTQTFFSALARKVKTETGKDWLDINKDVEFHAFMGEQVPYTNQERQYFLNEAKGKLDVSTAAQFYIDYAGTLSSDDKGAALKEPAVPEELIQPDTTSGDSLPPAREEKTYTTDEINQFYRDRREGKYKGKEAEAREIEIDILAAGRDGRIVDKRRYATA